MLHPNCDVPGSCNSHKCGIHNIAAAPLILKITGQNETLLEPEEHVESNFHVHFSVTWFLVPLLTKMCRTRVFLAFNFPRLTESSSPLYYIASFYTTHPPCIIAPGRNRSVWHIFQVYIIPVSTPMCCYWYSLAPGTLQMSSLQFIYRDSVQIRTTWLQVQTQTWPCPLG